MAALEALRVVEATEAGLVVGMVVVGMVEGMDAEVVVLVALVEMVVGLVEGLEVEVMAGGMVVVEMVVGVVG